MLFVSNYLVAGVRGRLQRRLEIELGGRSCSIIPSLSHPSICFQVSLYLFPEIHHFFTHSFPHKIQLRMFHNSIHSIRLFQEITKMFFPQISFQKNSKKFTSNWSRYCSLIPSLSPICSQKYTKALTQNVASIHIIFNKEFCRTKNGNKFHTLFHNFNPLSSSS